ncbi:MAG: hypothetical protein ACOYU2_03810 [Nitrospirota bacterium]
MKGFIKIVLFLGIIVFALYIGWGWGRIDAWSEGYNHAIDEVKMELKSAIEDGVPFWFGDIRFVPRRNGTAKAVIVKAEDEGAT